MQHEESLTVWPREPEEMLDEHSELPNDKRWVQAFIAGPQTTSTECQEVLQPRVRAFRLGRQAGYYGIKAASLP